MRNINLNKAPLVIKSRKTVQIRMLGERIADRDNILVDMSKQGLADIRYIMKQIAINDTEEEIAKKNYPSRVVVDNRESVMISHAKRKIEITFGNFLDKLLIAMIQRELMSAIRSYAARPEDAALGTMAYWEWAFAERPGQMARTVNIHDVKSLPIGSYLILKPRSNAVGIANMLAARKDAGWPEEKWWRRGRSRGRGFMAKGIDRLKRSRLMRIYTIHIVFTKRYMITMPKERYSHGTPVVVLRARRTGSYRRFRISQT